jgi:hypothetical protein
MRPRFLFAPLLAVLAGCATLTDTRTPAVEAFEAARKAPMLPINRSVTSFSDGLRCMDILFLQYGTHASLIVEDLNDKTQKSPAGTTEMFLGALSQMTRRSQAVRTVAFGEDTKNSANLMRLSGSKDAFQIENIPTYILRGAVSQFDDNLAKKTIDAGISLGPFSFGGAKSSSINMVGLDLVILRAHDFSVVPGVSAHNAAAILQEGEGLDMDVIYKKFGVNFMTSLSKSDGKTVALRNLAELGAIELMGKLNKIPYWKCLGVAGNQPDVVSEVDDWWEAMTTADKMRFFLQQFRAIGMVPASNAPVEPDTFKLAFRAYSQVLGFADNKTLSLGLFRAHFEADPDVVGPKAVALFKAEKQKLLALELKLEPTRSPTEASFALTTNHDAFVYCFLQDDKSKQIRGIFPHGFQRPAALRAGQPIALHELTRRAIVSHLRQAQTLACFSSAEDRTKDLPELFRSAAGAPIPGVSDFNRIKSQLAAGGAQLATATASFKGHPARPATELAQR